MTTHSINNSHYNINSNEVQEDTLLQRQSEEINMNVANHDNTQSNDNNGITTNDANNLIYESPQQQSAYSFKRNIVSEESFRIDSRKATLNYLFGFIPWRGHLGERPLDTRSKHIQSLYSHSLDSVQEEIQQLQQTTQQQSQKQKQQELSLNLLGNYLYLYAFGWWLSALYLVFAIACCITVVFVPHGILMFQLSKYYWWPFDKLIIVDKQAPVRYNYILSCIIEFVSH